MSKSTAAAALSSLSHKYRNKIREVGKLKAELKFVTARAASGIAESETVEALSIEIDRLRLRNDTVANDLMKTQKALKLSEFNYDQRLAAFARVQAHLKDVDGVQADLRSSLSNWKSLSAILFVVGLGIGVLSTLAYITQVPL